jgi:hypothetical protein
MGIARGQTGESALLPVAVGALAGLGAGGDRGPAARHSAHEAGYKLVPCERLRTQRSESLRRRNAILSAAP